MNYTGTINRMHTMREQAFRREVASSFDKMQKVLTEHEQIRFVWLPITIQYIAWHYAHKAMETAAERKIAEFRKLSRTVRELEKSWVQLVSKDVSPAGQEKIRQEAMRFIEFAGWDFTTLYYSVNAEVKKKAPGFNEDDLRTNAIISRLFIDHLIMHNHAMDVIVAERMGTTPDNIAAPPPPQMLELRKAMDAYTGLKGLIDYREKNIMLAMNIIGKRINEMEFKVA